MDSAVIIHSTLPGDQYILPAASENGVSMTRELNGSTNIITYFGQQDTATYIRLLTSLQFYNTLPEPQPDSRSVSMQVFTPSDTASSSLPSNIATVTISILPVNDNPPQFSQASYNGSVLENAPPGTTVGVMVSATDADIHGNTAISYSIEGSNPYFTIDASTGLVSTLQPLDSEASSVREFTVVASDNNGPPPLTASVSVSVSVLDQNDNSPVFRQASYAQRLSESTSVNTVILTVSATDADVTVQNSRVSYQIQLPEFFVSGSGMNPTLSPDEQSLPFVIDSATGNISLTSPLDFELVPQYTFEVLATDGGDPALTGTARVVITVTDINDNPPLFSSSEYRESVPEDTAVSTLVLTISATDPDLAAAGNVSYSLVNTEHFAIDPVSGAVSLILPLDFESRQVHNFSVVATDQGLPPLSAEAAVVITVTNVNDNPPVFDPESYSFTVSENTQFEGQVAARDSDGDTIMFALEDDNFEIGSSTGIIRSRPGFVIDFELQRYHLLVVTATDGQSTASANVSITVIDANDNVPEFEQLLYTVNISESAGVGSIVSTVLARDSDSGVNAESTYSITDGNTGSVFSIGASSGVISLERELDFESLPSTQFLLTVTATNTAPPMHSTTTNVLVTVTNENDVPPFLSIAETNLVFTENSPPLRFASSITVTDVDVATHLLTQCEATLSSSPCNTADTVCLESISVNQSLAQSYSLQVSASDDMITVTGPATDAVYMEVLATLLYINSDSEPIPGPRDVEIVCEDELFSSNELNITITVELVNEFCPVLSAAAMTFSYSEGASELAIGQLAGFSLLDSDRPPHDTLQQLQITLSNRLDYSYESITVESSSLTVLSSDDSLGSGSTLGVDDLVITVMGPASVQDFSQVLQSLSYRNSRPEPTLGLRRIALLPVDGTADCATVELTLTISPVNDNPPDVALSLSDSVAYLEGSGRLRFAEEAGLTVSDPDHSELFLLQSSSVVLTGVLDSGMEVLEFNESSLPSNINASMGGMQMLCTCLLMSV